MNMKHTIDFKKIDLEKYYFDEEAAEEPVRFIESFITHTKGKMAGKPYLMQQWEKDLVRNLFGWKRVEDGLRKYREVFIMLARKNSKTTLSAAILIYMLIVNSKRDKGSEIYLGAGSREQARIAFTIIKAMIEQNKSLNNIVNVFQNSIEFSKTNSFLKAVSSDSGNLHGANLSACLIDEYHVFKSSDLYDTFKTSMAIREEPLLITITTAGSDRNSPCFSLYDYSKKIIDGVVENETFLPWIYEGIDSDNLDEVFSEENFRRANPSYGVSVREDYILEQVEKAKAMPSYVNAVKQLHLSIWVDSSSSWINTSEWNKNQFEYSEEDLIGQECWAGLDLANTRDLNAFVLVFPQPNGTFRTLNYTFIPREAGEKSDNISVGRPFIGWSNNKNNFLYLTERRTRDDEFIFEKIKELSQKFVIKNCGYDRWGSDQLAFKIESELGLKLSPFGQGYKSQSPAIKDLERLIIEGKLKHNGNPVMRWCISNVRIVKDDAGNVKMSKERSKEKIDAAVALVMALGQYNLDTYEDMANPEQESPYESGGFFFI
jgi:phage terminase large subunit-like protein